MRQKWFQKGHFVFANRLRRTIIIFCLAPAVRSVSAQIVLPASGIINTIAGNGTVGYSGDGVAAISSALFSPNEVAVDNAGYVYIVDLDNQRIRKVTASTGIIGTIAGNGTIGYSGDGETATRAAFQYPTGVAVDRFGNIYIADNGNNRIRKVTASNHLIRTIAGNGTIGYSGDGGAATSAYLDSPTGVAVDNSGNIYIADNGNNRIRKVAASTGIITTVAGSGTEGYSGDGGAATSAYMDSPTGVAVDSSGDIYIADNGNNRIRKVTASTGIITTVAGSGTEGYSGDGGAATSAYLDSPIGIAVDSAGDIYIADNGNNRIREVTVSTNIISTVAGNGNAVYSGDGGAATSASLDYPTGVAVDRAGNIYIADRFNNRVRAVGASSKASTSVSVSCTPNSITYGSNTICMAMVTGNNPTGSITWTENGDAWSTTTLSDGLTSVSGGATWPLGATTIIASYSGDSSNNSSNGSTNLTVSLDVPAISIDDLPSNALVGGNFTVTYNYWGNGETSVASTTPAICTISGNKVSYVQAGTCILTASATATTDFAAVTGDAQSFYVALVGQQTLYSYNIPSYGTGSDPIGYDAVGNVVGYTDSVMGVWGFSYDTLNRMQASSSVEGTYAGLQTSWSYDPFGNRTSENFSGNSNVLLPTSSTASYNTNNQIEATSLMLGTGLLYDGAGDVTKDNQNQYLYDADGRMCAVKNQAGTMIGYIYGADGTRVSTGTISTWGTCDPTVNGYQATKDSILGPLGGQLTETSVAANGAVTWAHTNVWVGGMLLAIYDSNGLHFYLNDWTGSRRVQTNYAGVVEQTCSNLPYGDGETCAPTPSENLYAGLDRDSESGLDHAMFRQYSSTFGRFISPDPSGLAFADPTNPQSLNLYSYALNNPLHFTDPTGLTICDWGSSDQGGEDYDDDPDCTDDGGTDVVDNTILTVPGNDNSDTSNLLEWEQNGNISTFIQFQQFQKQAPNNNPYNMITCTGVGRGLAGNTNLVGRQGGIPGQTVQLNTAAVTPTQFNVPNGAALSPFAPYINGTVGNARFNSITDVNGGRSPIPGVPVRLALQQLFPGQLILEIPGAKDQGANAPVSINVPQSLGCPAGTHP